MPIYNQDGMRRIDRVVERVEQTAGDVSGREVFDRAAPSERPASFRNDSGETIPAYGCMKLASGAKYATGPAVTFFIASKPGSTLLTDRFALNGPNPVDSGDHGICYLSGHTRALYNTGTPVAGDAFGPTPGQWYLTKDYPPIFRVAVIADSSAQHVYGQLHPIAVLRGELKDSLPNSAGAVAEGQTATAYFLDKDDTAVTAIEFEVTDVFGVFRGRGVDDFSSPHERGSKLTAEFSPDSAKWELTWMQPHALQIRGAINEPGGSGDDPGFVKADGSFSIESVAVMQPPGSIITDTDPVSTAFPVTNRAFDGDDGAIAIATWDEPTQSWLALDVPCPA